MIDLTPEERAELRREWEAAVPQCIHRDLVLSLLDALDAKDAELASVRALSEAERRVVEASLSTYSAAERGLPEMAQDIFRRERRDAVRALLALRKDQTDGD